MYAHLPSRFGLFVETDLQLCVVLTVRQIKRANRKCDWSCDRSDGRKRYAERLGSYARDLDDVGHVGDVAGNARRSRVDQRQSTRKLLHVCAGCACLVRNR